MMPLLIRQAAQSDAPVIARFNIAMAWETEHRRLDPATIGAGVRNLLSEPTRGFYIVAESEGRITGQLMITYEWSDWRNNNFWWIQSVYVLPDHRGAGVFTALYGHILAQARDSGQSCGLRLYVERENNRAKRVYERLGMKLAGYDMYEIDFVLPHSSPGV
jgi:GNAT superfamily N-acetyltransferase